MLFDWTRDHPRDIPPMLFLTDFWNSFGKLTWNFSNPMKAKCRKLPYIGPQASCSVDLPRRSEVVRGLKLRKTASELISGLSEYFPETRDRFVDKVPKFVDSWKFYTWWIVFSTPINFFEFFSSHYSWNFHAGMKKMEMSGIGFCIDCGHSRKATRPPCARNRALRVENNCVSRESAFREKNGEFPKMGAKKYFHPRQEHIFPESEKKTRGQSRASPVSYTHLTLPTICSV